MSVGGEEEERVGEKMGAEKGLRSFWPLFRKKALTLLLRGKGGKYRSPRYLGCHDFLRRLQNPGEKWLRKCLTLQRA